MEMRSDLEKRVRSMTREQCQQELAGLYLKGTVEVVPAITMLKARLAAIAQQEWAATPHGKAALEIDPLICTALSSVPLGLRQQFADKSYDVSTEARLVISLAVAKQLADAFTFERIHRWGTTGPSLPRD